MKARPWIESQTLQENFLRTGDPAELHAHLASGGSPNIHFGPTSLLYHAADIGHIEAVRLLLEHGADPNGVPRRNPPIPPIRNASSRGHVDIVRLLLAAGADVNARDIQGDTAILKARQQDQLEVAQILLEAGADPSIENAGGESALNCHFRNAKTDRVGEFLRSSNYSTGSVPPAKAATPEVVEKKDAHRADPLQAIREMGTAGGNYDVSTDDILARLQQWNDLYGVTVADISGDSLRVTFHRLPDSVESLAQEIEEFCPDVVAQGFGCYAEMCSHLQDNGEELPSEVAELVEGVDMDDENYGLVLLARALRRDRTVILWWD